MKKFLRTLLCGAVLALTMSTAAFAAENDLLIAPNPNAMPARQGDFYVMINGEYVTFPDAVPQGRDNRSFLPMAATFSQLGFAEKDMTWNTDGVITATKGDLTISMTIGKKEITLTKAGETTVIPVDVAPYVDSATWRTYVPFGLAAEVLGYKVGWDGSTGTVLIDDVDAIWAENTETYELMDKYMAYSKDLAGDKVRLSGTYSANVYACDWAGLDVSEVSFLLDGDYDAYSATPAAIQFETDMDMTLAAYYNGEDVTQAMLDSGELPALPESFDFDMRGDLAQGTLYLQSAALCALMEQPDMANAWFKLDFNALMEGSGMNWSELMSSALEMQNTQASFSETMKLMIEATPIAGPGMTTKDYLAMYNAMFADSAFVQEGNAYTNEMSFAGMPMSLTLLTNSAGTKVTGCSVDLYMTDPSMGQMLISVAMQDEKLGMYMAIDTSYYADLSADSGSYFLMEMLMDGTYLSTAASPDVEPPAGAVIVDLMELMADELSAQSAP